MAIESSVSFPFRISGSWAEVNLKEESIMLQCFPNELWINAFGPTSKVVKLHILHTSCLRRMPLQKGRSLDASTKQDVGLLRNKSSFKSQLSILFNSHASCLQLLCVHFFSRLLYPRLIIWWAVFFSSHGDLLAEDGMCQISSCHHWPTSRLTKRVSPVVGVRCIHVSRCIP